MTGEPPFGTVVVSATKKEPEPMNRIPEDLFSIEAATCKRCAAIAVNNATRPDQVTWRPHVRSAHAFSNFNGRSLCGHFRHTPQGIVPASKPMNRKKDGRP